MTFYNTERITLGNFLNRHPNIRIVDESTSKNTLHIRVMDCHPNEVFKIRAHLQHAFGLTPIAAKEKLLNSHGNHELVFKGAVNNQKVGEIKVLNLQGRFLSFFGALKKVNPYTNREFEQELQKANKIVKRPVRFPLRLKKARAA